MVPATLRSRSQQVGLAVVKLSGKTGEWALTCDAFRRASHIDSLKRQMSRVFAMSSQAYLVHSRFLAFRQELKESSDYVQVLRTLLAATQLDNLLEKV